MTAPTHRYHGTGLRRADGSTVEPGETLTPTEAELRAFGDSFEELDRMVEAEESDDDSDDDAEAEADGGERPSPANSDAEMTVADAQSILSDAGVDYDDYSALQDLAGEYDDVPGSGISTEELQVRLAKKLTGQA